MDIDMDFEARIRGMIERHNNLKTLADGFVQDIEGRDLQISTLGNDIKQTISSTKEQLQKLLSSLELLTKGRELLSKEFRDVVKVETYNKLSRRIDSLNYEQKITRNELMRIKI